MASTQDRIRVALLYGGRSGEHDISVRSAESIRPALDPSRYSISDIFITREGKWMPGPLLPVPESNPGIDVVFPMLHGTFGEDGTVQGLLELAGLPYVSAGVLASAVSMDKAMTKRLCRLSDLPVVEHVVLTRECIVRERVVLPFAYPVFVKPLNLGSSVGISKVRNEAGLIDALRLAARFDNSVIVERGVSGREFECAVLGGSPPKASIPCEIFPSQEFYTYEDKYLLDRTRIDLPAKLTAEQTAAIQRMAIAAFQAVNCECMARVDFLMDGETAQLYVNEINTIPGFTSISMFPKMWEYSGLPYPRLLDRLIELALERAEMRSKTQYAR